MFRVEFYVEDGKLGRRSRSALLGLPATSVTTTCRTSSLHRTARCTRLLLIRRRCSSGNEKAQVHVRQC